MPRSSLTTRSGSDGKRKKEKGERLGGWETGTPRLSDGGLLIYQPTKERMINE
jgi:hypothetical protein